MLARDQRGFVLAGPDFDQEETGWPLDRPPYHLETSVPGVFVAGDVRSESAKRVASAVGEGAMAVMFVHRYLETLLPDDAGDAMTVISQCDPAELRTLFLFEKLTDEQLSGCAARATSRSSSPGRSSPRATRRRTCTC